MRHTKDIESTIALLNTYKQDKIVKEYNELVNDLINEIMYYDMEKHFLDIAKLSFSNMNPFWESLDNSYRSAEIKAFYWEFRFLVKNNDKEYLRQMFKNLKDVVRLWGNSHPDIQKSMILISILSRLIVSTKKKEIISTLRAWWMTFIEFGKHKHLYAWWPQRKKKSEDYMKKKEKREKLLRKMREEKRFDRPYTSSSKIFDDIKKPKPIDREAYDQMARPFRNKEN
mgnify:CR=1 FL=1